MKINSAMVMAAGLGTRMRPITDKVPKPLVKVNGIALIDRMFIKLKEAKVENILVNVHYLPELIEQHIAESPYCKGFNLKISYEDQPLEYGGVVQALPFFEQKPFFIVNSDIILLDQDQSFLETMDNQWNPNHMDALMLLAATDSIIAYHGKGDFNLSANDEIIRNEQAAYNLYLYAGVQIVKPEIFTGFKIEKFRYFKDLIYPKYQDSHGRLKLIKAVKFNGTMIHVDSPAGLIEAEEYFINYRN